MNPFTFHESVDHGRRRLSSCPSAARAVTPWSEFMGAFEMNEPAHGGGLTSCRREVPWLPFECSRFRPQRIAARRWPFPAEPSAGAAIRVSGGGFPRSRGEPGTGVSQSWLEDCPAPPHESHGLRRLLPSETAPVSCGPGMCPAPAFSGLPGILSSARASRHSAPRFRKSRRRAPNVGFITHGNAPSAACRWERDRSLGHRRLRTEPQPVMRYNEPAVPWLQSGQVILFAAGCRGRRDGFGAGDPRDDQPTVRSRNLAPAAPSPTPAAAAATSAAAAPAATPAAATATAAAADPGDLLPERAVLLVEQMECGEADVGHLFFAENEALPGHGQTVVSLRHIRGRQRRCGRRSSQRKPKSRSKSGGAQRRRGSGFARAVLFSSLLHPCHGRFLPYVSIQVDVAGEPAPPTNAKASQAVPICESFFLRYDFRLPLAGLAGSLPPKSATDHAIDRTTDHLGTMFL